MLGRFIGSVFLVAVLASCAQISPEVGDEGPVTLQSVDEDERLTYLREAVAWSPIDTPSLDLRKGPKGGRFAAGAVLECDFVMPDETPSGYTPKFLCRAADGKTYKIKYGVENLEVYGEVAGSRLLWSLGFFSDRVDPITVRCGGCPEDPWAFMKGKEGGDLPPKTQVRKFEPAAIESYYGTLIESEPEEGINWEELLGETSRDASRAREQRVHREALALLMGFLQHADSKPSQQTLSCAPGARKRGANGAETCQSPVLYIGDIGAILGDGWKYKRVSTTKVDFERWRSTSVWRDAESCTVAVNGRPNATLDDVRISEAARRFLAERLSLLSRRQVHDLFDVARVDLLGETTESPSGEKVVVGVDEWTEIFLKKTSEIAEARCPA